MSKRVDSELYYVTFEMFVADAKRMFANARTYNSPDTIYYKCATRHGVCIPCHFYQYLSLVLMSIDFILLAGWKLTLKAKCNQVSKLAPKFSSELNEHIFHLYHYF